MYSRRRAGSTGPVPGVPMPDAVGAQALDVAHALGATGLPLAAIVQLESAVAADPSDADAWAAYGDALLDVGRASDAAHAYANAATLDPLAARRFRAWAEAQAAAGAVDDAFATWRRALERWPSDRECRLGIARLAKNVGRDAEAAVHFREALFLDPGDAESWIALGAVLLGQGLLPDAIDALQRALRLNPERADAHLHLGRAWFAAADRDRAEAAFSRALELDPDDGLGVRAHLARLADAGAETLSPDFVRCLFDQYAAKFDADLLGPLAYRGPGVVAEALAGFAGPPEGRLAILDLGCGTGLVGVALKPFARRLVGVDLSPQMLAEAERRGIYDALIAGEMMAALGAGNGPWDVVVFGDSLPYVGDLAAILRAAAAAISPGGHVVATLEAGEQTDGFVLQPTRRFAHGPAYVRRAAECAGLCVRSLDRIAVRHEKTKPVPGLIGVFSGD